ncbi:MAG: hypothetical protein ACRC8S_15100 [Fimbriiglobus sp.]
MRLFIFLVCVTSSLGLVGCAENERCLDAACEQKTLQDLLTELGKNEIKSIDDIRPQPDFVYVIQPSDKNVPQMQCTASPIHTRKNCSLSESISMQNFRL